MRRRLLVLAMAALAAAGLATVAAPASAKVTQLGPPPVAGDCFVLGLAEGTQCYYSNAGIEFSMGKHILRPGETTTARMSSQTWISFKGFEDRWVVRQVSRTFSPAFTIESEGCRHDYYFAAEASCTIKAGAATGGWRTHGYTLSIVGSRPYETGDYFAIVGPGTYEIAGTVRGRDRGEKKDKPVPGATMIVEQIGGAGDKYTQVTNANGRYSVLVEEGTWRVRSTKAGVCHDIPGRTGCARSATVSTPGDRTVDFVGDAPVTISGKVATTDDGGIEGAKIRAVSADGDTREAISEKDGSYTIEDIAPNVAWTLDSPGAGDVCPEISGTPELLPNGRCKEPTTVVTPKADLTQNWRKPGCVSTIEFGAMKAKAECFETDGPGQWHTTKPFRMNGLDFLEGGNVSFDATKRTVEFAGLRSVRLPVTPLNINAIMPPVPGGTLVFEGDSVKLSVLFPTDATFKGFGGFPATSIPSVELSGGTSTIGFDIAMPTDPTKAFDWKSGSFGDGKGVLGVGMKLASDNERGVHGVEIGATSSGDLPAKKIFENPIFKLSELKLGYDLSTDEFTIGGKASPSFLNPASSAPAVGAVPSPDFGTKASRELGGTLVTRGIPFLGGEFKTLDIGVDGLNMPAYGKLIKLQRINTTLPLGSLHHDGPGTFSAGLGFSLLDRYEQQKLGPIITVPNEIVGVDGRFDISYDSIDVSGGYPFFNGLAISGAIRAKIWDRDVGLLTAGIWPTKGIIGGKLEMKLRDPMGGSFFSIGGAGELWMDALGNRLYAAARGDLRIAGIGGVGDLVITGSTLEDLLAAGCADAFGHRMGFNFVFSTRAAKYGSGCDVSEYKALRPPVPDPPKAARAGATGAQKLALRRAAQAPGKTKQTFTATGEEQLLTFQVGVAQGAPGTGAPVLKLTGPGKLSLTSKPDVAVKTAKAMAVPLVDAREVSFVVDAPKPGKYTIEVVGKGGPAITAPKFASLLPPPVVKAELVANQCAPTISWTTAALAGQTLRFKENASDGSQRVIGESTAATGKLPITPLVGAGRSEVTVEVLNGQTVRDTFTVGTYNAGVPDQLPGPSALGFTKAKAIKVKQGKKTVSKKATTIGWGAVCGAEAYAVQVGKKPAVVVTGTSLVIERPKKGVAISVTSLGRLRTPGGSTLLPFA